MDSSGVHTNSVSDGYDINSASFVKFGIILSSSRGTRHIWAGWFFWSSRVCKVSSRLVTHAHTQNLDVIMRQLYEDFFKVYVSHTSET